ncbi:MAG: formylglycine-generating enzyme family protein [Verrucomicrobiota bacterium]
MSLPRMDARLFRYPSWACSYGEDRFGIFASFAVGEEIFVMRWIPPGRFVMGSPEEEAGRWDDEGPMHEVTLTEGFWMGQTPVTQGQWEGIMGENPSHFSGAKRPVETVSWEDCQRFLERLEEQVPGLRPRLPTEAQWEYACRAGTEAAFSDGSECTEPAGKDPALEKLGWYGKNSGGSTQEVGEKASNAWGLQDVHGNVWEWCGDGMRDFGREPVVDPVGPVGDSAPRVLRGGSWARDAGGCRSAFRNAGGPGSRIQDLGLRLVAGQPGNRR